MKKLFLLLTLIFLISCKNSNSEVYSLRVIFDLKIKENDKFKFYYKSDGESFSKDKSIVQNVIGNEGFQKIKFIAPSLAPSIRLDYGTEKNQEITIKNITFKYKDKKYVINQNDVHKAFAKNKWIELVDKNNAIYRPKIIENKARPKLFLKKHVVEDIISQFKGQN
ncbi:hypothetical protein [Idiomarina abyssalis]|uniref:hypothetical protein n=1 Tax=Idiomarina abyssalis TaxID=86102 RepID=UPI003A92DF36